MTYTYDRTKTAYGRSRSYEPPLDPPESRADKLEPSWDSLTVASMLEDSIKDELIEKTAPHLAKVTDGRMRLEVKRVSASEDKYELEDYDEIGSGRHRRESWRWSVSYNYHVDLEILGVGGKRLTENEVFELLFGDDLISSEVEADGVDFELFFEPDIDISYSRGKLKVTLSGKMHGSYNGSYEDFPDY